ncbi:hypothetical protein ACHAXN_003238 [Cyclotella atomus]
MDRPRTPKELRRFIGCVNYYRDMWPSRAHVLKPLTDQAGLKKGEKLNWTPAMQTAFNKMRLLLAADALAAYPDHNKRFDIYTDSSDYQLGACIMQEGRVVAYFSRKLSNAQRNYITMEKEMLSIVADNFTKRRLSYKIKSSKSIRKMNEGISSKMNICKIITMTAEIAEFSPSN